MPETRKRRSRSKSKTTGGRAPFLRRHASLVKSSSPISFARAYFASKIIAPFLSPLADEYEFKSATPLALKYETRSGWDLALTIDNDLQNVAWYLSRYLNFPRYAKEQEIGFARGDTLRPVDLSRENGAYRYGVRGLAIGRRDMLRFLKGPNASGPAVDQKAPPKGWTPFVMYMPTEPDAAEVEDDEWYYFNPGSWKRRHPDIPLKAIPMLIRKRVEAVPVIAPQYDKLYRDGVIRIAFLFGYDKGTHFAADDARELYGILTARPTKIFKRRDTGKYGYHGPGLGFSDPLNGQFARLNANGTTVFRRDSASGSGPVGVRYRLENGPLVVGDARAPEGTVYVGKREVRAGTKLPLGTMVTRAISAEVRLYNFDKVLKHTSSQKLIENFVSVFRDNDVVHYDGHANYGGGFFIGERSNDLLWADHIGEYADDFSKDYQIFSIGACHAAGYFADLFYNELGPKKSPDNLDIIAAVNETSFADAVQGGAEIIRALLQHRSGSFKAPPDYDRVLRALNEPAAFQAYIGVFGRPRTEKKKTAHP